MEKLTKGIITGLILGLIPGTFVGYIIHNSINRNFMQVRGDFQIDKNTQNEIISFFESTSDINEINSYCEQNRMYCSYYCRTINPNHEICKNIMNFSGMNGGRQWNP